MDRSPQQDTSASHEVVIEEAIGAPVERSWADVQQAVARAVPRLREIAMQVAVVGVLVAPITDSWSVGGGRGC